MYAYSEVHSDHVKEIKGLIYHCRRSPSLLAVVVPCYGSTVQLLSFIFHWLSSGNFLLFFPAFLLALFTGDPQNTTALVGTQAFFNCSFKNLTTLPIWEDSRGQSYSSSSTGEVRFIQISTMEIALNVTATQDRDGVCYFCAITLVSGDGISSGSGCLTVAGKYR